MYFISRLAQNAILFGIFVVNNHRSLRLSKLKEKPFVWNFLLQSYCLHHRDVPLGKCFSVFCLGSDWPPIPHNPQLRSKVLQIFESHICPNTYHYLLLLALERKYTFYSLVCTQRLWVRKAKTPFLPVSSYFHLCTSLSKKRLTFGEKHSEKNIQKLHSPILGTATPLPHLSSSADNSC